MTGLPLGTVDAGRGRRVGPMTGPRSSGAASLLAAVRGGSVR
jgi:hypothetical protein